MEISSTILAIASPSGRSARGIIRISGDHAVELVRPHLLGKHAPPRPATLPANHLLPVTLVQLLAHPLPALVILFESPRSFTGQNALELQVPGNSVLLERLIDALIRSGDQRGLDVRRAMPGEFTARAFFLGKLSLTEAEGVAAIIGAQSDAELRAAQILCSGSLGGFASALAARLAEALALVEAGIDFTDQEDVVPVAAADLIERLRALQEEVRRQLDRSIGTEQLEAIPWVVLAGPANAGKSTLFNALLGRQRAVVSSIAGTTRDVLAEPLAVATTHGNAELMLVDLAGEDAAEDPLKRGMRFAAGWALDRAELVLYCVPVDEEVPETKPDHAVLVRTKADRLAAGASHPPGDLVISVEHGQGLDDLRSLLGARISDRAVSLSADLTALRPRHEAALRSSADHLSEALQSLEHAHDRRIPDPEITAASMRAALDQLSALAGDITPDDILGRVFATFCVGK